MVQKNNSSIKRVIAIIAFGSIWGLFEMTLGSYLHVIHYPGTGRIMTGIGYAILAVYAIKYKNFWHLLIIGCIAASFKFLNVFIYSVPLFSQGIVNPALSIIKEAAIASVISCPVILILQTKLVKNALRRLKDKS